MSAAPRIVFAGTPDFAVPALDALADWHLPLAVYTQPDRPAGRGRELTPSPVKLRAQHWQIQVRQPASLDNSMAAAALAELRPDVMVVAAYGLILPRAILAVPRIGCINIHASLLPRWRGAAPVQRAIMAGDSRTGISIMQMAEGLDTGDVLLQKETIIADDDTGGSLHNRLAALGAEALLEVLPAVLAGEIQGVPQDDSPATYAQKLKKEEAMLDWMRPAGELALQVRAMNPWPVCECLFEERRLRVWQARAVDEKHNARPGDITAADASGIKVACGEGQLLMMQVQLPGRRRVSAREFLNARTVKGVRLVGRKG